MPDYFREYLKIAPLSHALWRANEAYEVEKIRFHPPILDLGCGFGEFAGVFFDSRIEMGADISREEIFQAIKSGKYKEVLEADARNLPFSEGSFSTVISISTLEHIEDVEKVFPEVYRVLRKGGLFIFTVPTIEVYNQMLFPTLFKKLSLNPLADLYCRLYDRSFKHKSMYPAETWKKMAKDVGFEITHLQGTLSPKAIVVFELFLPLALPTQFFKAFLGKRLPLSPKWRVALLHKWFKSLTTQRDKSESNTLIVARKTR